MGHPKFEDVLGWSALADAADMTMHINKAWQNVLSLEVNFSVARFWPAAVVQVFRASRRVADRHDLGDPVAFNNDVYRAHRRSASTVNQNTATENQAVVGSFTLSTIGCDRYLGAGLCPG